MQRSGIDKPRLEAIDLARGLALAAMAIYHFAWDLEFFGYAPHAMTAQGGWKIFARCIASSFLFLVGVSLFLGHAKSIRLPPFLRRLARVTAAAAAISLITWFAVPGGFIFFGILHQIALASILGLAFVRVPVAITVLLALFVLSAPHFLRSTFFDHPALLWNGLSSVNPRSNDYVPLFPWFGAVLFGIAAAKVAADQGLFEKLSRWRPGSWSTPFQAAGRHSLAVYLIHQPVLIGAIWLFAQVSPAPQPTAETQFMRACQAQCQNIESGEFCDFYCVCVMGTLENEGRMEEVVMGTVRPETSERLQEIVAACTVDAEYVTKGENDG